MVKKWKDESVDYKQRLFEKYSLKSLFEKYNLNENIEDFDINNFKKNPKKFFEETDWTIPQEHFEEIVETLSEIANSDSEISLEGMDLGSKGEYIQNIVQKLMQTDNNFAKVIGQVGKKVESKMTEGKGKGRKILMASLLCLSVLAGAVSCSSTSGISFDWAPGNSHHRTEITEVNPQDLVQEKIPSIRFNFKNSQEYGVYVKIYKGKKLVFSTTLYRGETKWKETQVSQMKSFFDDAQDNLYTNTNYSIYVENKLAYQGPIKTNKIEITGYKDKNHIEQYKVSFKYL